MIEAAYAPAPEGNREVAANKAAFDQKVTDIREHPALSDVTKKRYLNEAYQEAQARYEELPAR
jgi:hypothetical protein